ncbi:MAG: hypothetical protein AABZ74_06985 [Cyanobacteriota bacterium]
MSISKTKFFLKKLVSVSLVFSTFLSSCTKQNLISPQEDKNMGIKNVPESLFKENNKLLQLNGLNSYLTFDTYFDFDRVIVRYRARDKKTYPLLTDGDGIDLFALSSVENICAIKPFIPDGKDFTNKAFDYLYSSGNDAIAIKDANWGNFTNLDFFVPKNNTKSITFGTADWGIYTGSPASSWKYELSRTVELKKTFKTSQNPLTIGKGKLFCNDKTNASEFFDGEIESIDFYSKFKEVGSYRLEKSKVVNGKLPNLLTGKYDVTLHGSFEVKKWATQDTTKLNDPNYYFDAKLRDTASSGDNFVTLFSNNGNNLYGKIINSNTKQIVKDEFLISANTTNGKVKYFGGNLLISYQDISNGNIYFKQFDGNGNLIKDATQVNVTQLPNNVSFNMNVDPSQRYFGFSYDNLDISTWSNTFPHYTHSSVFARVFDQTSKPHGNELQISKDTKYQKQSFYAPAIALYENSPKCSIFCNTQYADTNSSINPLVNFIVDFDKNTISNFTGGFGANSYLPAKVFTQKQDSTDDSFKVFYGADFVNLKMEGCCNSTEPLKLNEGSYSTTRGFSANAITLYNSNMRRFYNDYIFSYVSTKDAKSKYQLIKNNNIFSEVTGRENVLSSAVAYVSDGFISSEQVGNLVTTWKYNNNTWEILDVISLTDALKIKPTQVVSYPYQIAVIQNGNQTSFNLYYGEPSSTATISIALTADSKPILTQNVTLDINGKASIPLPNGVSNGDYFVWVTAANSNVRGNIEKFTVTAPVSTGQGDTTKPVIRPPSPTPILVNNSAPDFGSPEIFETCYLTTFDDVREAVKNKKTIPSGQHHFAYHGLLEGRGKNTTFLRCVDAMKNGFSEKEYLSLYPDVKIAVKNGSLYSGLKHYILDGFSENKFKNYSEAIKDRDSIPLIAGNNNSYVEKNKIDRFYLPVLKGHTYNVIISPKDGYSIDNIDLRVLYPNSNNIINYKSSSSYNLYSSKLGKYRVLNYESIIDGKLYFYISSSGNNYYSINILDINILPEIEEVQDYEELINEPTPILFGVRSPLDYIFDLNNPVFQGAFSALPNPLEVIDAVKVYMNHESTPSEIAWANVNVWSNVPVLGAAGKAAKLFKVVEKIEDASKGIIKVTVKKISVKIAFKSLKDFKYADKFGIRSYKELNDTVAKSGLPRKQNLAGTLKKSEWVEVHHIPDERFAKIGTWEQKSNDMLSIVLTREEHEIFTASFRKIIGNKGDTVTKVTTYTATKQDIINATKEVYREYPEILKALKF